jgi:hypothetical protein
MLFPTRSSSSESILVTVSRVPDSDYRFGRFASTERDEFLGHSSESGALAKQNLRDVKVLDVSWVCGIKVFEFSGLAEPLPSEKYNVTSRIIPQQFRG